MRTLKTLSQNKITETKRLFKRKNILMNTVKSLDRKPENLSSCFYAAENLFPTKINQIKSRTFSQRDQFLFDLSSNVFLSH